MLPRATAVFLMSILSLGGCAARRTAEGDRAVRSAVVASLLNESTPIRHVGLTVFNNGRANVEQGGKLRQAIVESVTRRLNFSRPGWVVKVDETDLAVLIEKNRGSGDPGGFASNHAQDLMAIAQRLDADLLFVLVDRIGQNHPGQGVGITFRALGNDPETVSVHSFIALHVIDRNG